MEFVLHFEEQENSKSVEGADYFHISFTIRKFRVIAPQMNGFDCGIWMPLGCTLTSRLLTDREVARYKETFYL